MEEITETPEWYTQWVFNTSFPQQKTFRGWFWFVDLRNYFRAGFILK